nr:EOG090X026V [Cyclestheria hislopi]
MFILQGPDEDQEAELNLTVTELIELRKKRELMINQLENEEKEEEEPSETKSSTTASEGVDWGMGEDAYDENPLAENPFATELDAVNEELYLDDPKKTLRGWFEREGYDLEYKVEERGFAHFICRVELPVEATVGMPLIAEAVVKSGKKKEAVVQCALEACRMLDRHGLLRQSTHESKRRRKKRLEDEDYYSSDEDTFLDRTGTIEKKREARMKASGKTAETVETYESLVAKYESIEREISEVRQTLNEIAVARSKPTIDVDDLDMYMSSLQEEMAGKKESSAKLKAKLSQLQLEEVKLRKLINLTKPALMPEIKAPVLKEPVIQSSPKETTVDSLPKKESEIPAAAPVLKKAEPELSVKKIKEEPKQSAQQQPSRKSGKKNVLGPLLPPDLLKQLREESIRNEEEEKKAKEQQTQEEEEDREKTGLVIRKRKKTETETEAEETKKPATDVKVDYDASDTSKYAMWLPPEDQTGDGKTSLNKKLGY